MRGNIFLAIAFLLHCIFFPLIACEIELRNKWTEAVLKLNFIGNCVSVGWQSQGLLLKATCANHHSNRGNSKSNKSPKICLTKPAPSKNTLFSESEGERKKLNKTPKIYSFVSKKIFFFPYHNPFEKLFLSIVFPKQFQFIIKYSKLLWIIITSLFEKFCFWWWMELKFDITVGWIWCVSFKVH